MNEIIPVLLRVGLVAVALVIWFWTQRLIAAKAPAGDRIGDWLHDVSAPWNTYLQRRPRAANATLITTSAFIDLFALYLVVLAVWGSTLRPFIALLLVFSLRQICQGICTLPFPSGTIWRHPGFPSLMVTYGTSNDFFFSGHTAIAVLGAMELARSGPPWLAAVGIVIAVCEGVAVIILRAHYTMDVFAAVFAAWGCEVAATRIAPAVDAWLTHLTP